MIITRTHQCSVFHSWDKEDRTALQVILLGDVFLLQHIDTRYLETSLTILQIEAAEAKGVAERIQNVLRGDLPGNPNDDLLKPYLRVVLTTDGEPYREGVRLSLCAGNWESDFDFGMTKETAMALAEVLSSTSTLTAPLMAPSPAEALV